MSQYVYAVGGALAYGKRYYASPMKELNQKTVLTEDAKINSNDSYRQHTKYNDSVDSYYSTYDLGILLHNEESYLEGTIDGEQDADYYSFSYQQKNFYSQMYIASEVEILLECKDSDCSLTVYDSYGNQGKGQGNWNFECAEQY